MSATSLMEPTAIPGESKPPRAAKRSRAARKPEGVDGRTLRRSRNRAAVLDALIAMIQEGDLQPSAVEIADRAGVSHRSIFRYFDDLDDLTRTSIEHAFSDAASVGRIDDLGTGTLEERIASFIDARIKLYRHVDGPMQVARMKAPAIPSIDQTIGEIARASRTQIARQFAPEVGTRSEGDAELLIDSVLVASSYDAYTIHVRLLDSSTGRVRAAMVYALSSLLRI